MKKGTSLSVSVQYANDGDPPQPRWRVRALIRAALLDGGEVVVRFVGESEMTTINLRACGKKYPTNILSFAYPGIADNTVRGDIIICPPVAKRAAATYQKPPAHHFAHLIVHGALHLSGHRHNTATAAAAMERTECAILRRFNIANPYLLS